MQRMNEFRRAVSEAVICGIRYRLASTVCKRVPACQVPRSSGPLRAVLRLRISRDALCRLDPDAAAPRRRMSGMGDPNCYSTDTRDCDPVCSDGSARLIRCVIRSVEREAESFAAKGQNTQIKRKKARGVSVPCPVASGAARVRPERPQ